jgi:hypothetical protein
MNPISRAILLSFALFSSAVNADEARAARQTFGEPMPEGVAAVRLGQAVERLQEGRAEEVKVRGQITEVCQAKGCWMILVDGEQFARITFKDYGFFVPTQTSMQDAVVFGVLEETTLSVETAAHYAADAGKHEQHDQLLAQSSSITEYSLVASSVQIEPKI